MEELILKYIDGTASETEKAEVQKLLKSDPEFSSLYREFQKLEHNLQRTISERYDDIMHDRIQNSVYKAYKGSLQKELIPARYFGIIIFIALSIIVVAIWQYGSTEGILTEYISYIAGWSSIIAWLSVSFLILLAFDQIVRKMVTYRLNYQS